jgi:hypothetical protein
MQLRKTHAATVVRFSSSLATVQRLCIRFWFLVSTYYKIRLFPESQTEKLLDLTTPLQSVAATKKGKRVRLLSNVIYFLTCAQDIGVDAAFLQQFKEGAFVTAITSKQDGEQTQAFQVAVRCPNRNQVLFSLI